MKRLSILLCVAVLCSGACAEKLSIDPYKNGGSTPSLETKEAAGDSRLAQKITYTITDKRLHTVLEELTKQTGVKIESGKNLYDWPVRDIPLIICVKDIALGKLMRTIADATHLAFTSTTVKGVKRYRIWRDNARQNQLSNYFAEMEDTTDTRLSAQWDAWIKINEKGVPKNTNASQIPDETEMLRSTANVMAALPAGSREAVISGKTLSFGIKTASPQLAAALRAYFSSLEAYAKAKYEHLSSEFPADERNRFAKPRDLTDFRLEQYRFTAGSLSSSIESEGGYVNDDKAALRTQSTLYIGTHFQSRTGVQDCFTSPITGSEALQLIGEEAQKYPDELSTACSPGMRKIDAENSQIAELNQTFKIPKPKDAAKRTFADTVVDVATASGFSIVCEDFQSHRKEYNTDEFTCYDNETTLKELMVAPADLDRDWSTVPMLLRVEWLIDPAGKTLIGWHPSWWVQHKALAPEKLISGLVKKLNGEGLELDDIAATLLLPKDQCTQWVVRHKDLAYRNIRPRPIGYLPLWKLYAGLSPENKALAKSKVGLLLAGLNREAVMSALVECAENVARTDLRGQSDAIYRYMETHPELMSKIQEWIKKNNPQLSDPETASVGISENDFMLDGLEAFPELEEAFEVPPPTDPAAVLSLKMRLIRVDDQSILNRYDQSSTFQGGLGEKKPHTYSLVFEGNGVRTESGDMIEVYPVYSEERIAELTEDGKKKSEKKEAGANEIPETTFKTALK